MAEQLFSCTLEIHQTYTTMKGIIRFISYIAIIVGVAFFINNKLKLHIDILEVKSMTTLYIFIGAVVVGIAGLYFTRD